MNVLDRLKLELNNKEYFADEQYSQFLNENGFEQDELTEDFPEYEKETMQKSLLMSVLDILEAVSNDIDIMRLVQTEFTNTSQAYKYMEHRIQQVKDRIASIPEPEEGFSPFSLMYTRK